MTTASSTIDRAPAPSSRTSRVIWAGRILSALPVLLLLVSASLKLTHAPAFVEKWVDMLGFKEASLTPIGVLEVLCVLVYLVPRTAVLGAILLTAYLGGAVTTHVRVGDSFFVPVVLGVLVWGGLYLREGRLRALTPLRR